MKEKELQSSSKMVIFKGEKIRRIWNKDEWFYSVVDICGALTDSPTPRQYWGKIKDREFTKLELSPIWVQLKIPAPDGKMRMTDCVNTKGAFRLIQSIPSPKAEPFKRWLAKVGYERIQEIEDPEIALKRTREIYRAKGYSDPWIEKRMRGIAVRDELTKEWDQRGIKEKVEYSILTAEISKATFGMSPKEYKNHKKLDKPNQNLRDHMTDLELIFTMLGEASTTEIATSKDTQGFSENKIAAKKGGKIAGDARKNLEIESGKKIVTDENYLEVPEKIKRLKGK